LFVASNEIEIRDVNATLCELNQLVPWDTLIINVVFYNYPLWKLVDIGEPGR